MIVYYVYTVPFVSFITRHGMTGVSLGTAVALDPIGSGFLRAGAAFGWDIGNGNGKKNKGGGRLHRADRNGFFGGFLSSLLFPSYFP
jgi:hypothetical protein